MPLFASMSGRFARAVLFPALVCVAWSTLPVSEAQAQSRRDRDISALTLKMAGAEARYRDALIKVQNNDPNGLLESNSALEDMEDVIDACMKLKGCPVSTLLASYKRLLKTEIDEQARNRDDGEEGIADEPGNLPTGDVPQTAEAAALLTADKERLQRLVQMNPAVQAGIRRWLTDMRVSLVQSHENYQYLRHLMSPAFQRNGMPEALLFGIMAKESTGRAHIGSRAGAVGLLQFMPATGRRFGLGVDGTGFDTRYDAKMSAEAAAAYLNERYAEFGNNIELWLAAYNGGEGRALRVYRGSSGRSFWDESVYEQFPAETKDYVPMVIAASWLYMHPKEYGLTFPKVDAKPATIKLVRPATIYELTICLGNGGTRDGYMRALRNLNPRYEADGWIPSGTYINATVKIAGLYNRHCVQGARAELAKQLVASDPSSAIVRIGEIETTPSSAVGEDGTAVQQSAQGETNTPSKAESKPAETKSQEKPKAQDKKSKPKPVGRHKVARGDTLVSIAKKYSCDVGELAKANGIKGPRYSVKLGQRIILQGCKD